MYTIILGRDPCRESSDIGMSKYILYIFYSHCLEFDVKAHINPIKYVLIQCTLTSAPDTSYLIIMSLGEGIHSPSTLSFYYAQQVIFWMIGILKVQRQLLTVYQTRVLSFCPRLPWWLHHWLSSQSRRGKYTGMGSHNSNESDSYMLSR